MTDAKKSFGSGAVINDQGAVITNWHVVGGNPRVLVVFKPKNSTELKEELAYAANVEKIDEVADLALLRIIAPRKPIPYLQLGDPSAISVGHDVHAIGHPDGEAWTYTKGIISQIRDNYEWSAGDGRTYRAKVIQTQTPINPGNSGGPLLDDSGRLIGINSFFSPQAQGLSFAVAVDTIKEFLQRPGSRVSSPSEPPGPEPRCPDAYDTTGRGWTDIVGCYRSVSTPPPDFWSFLRTPDQLAYSASSMLHPGRIDTVITNTASEKDELTYLIDVDCNGSIDLIGHQGKGSNGITGFSLPPKPMRMLNLAKELDTALKLRKIPYQNLKVCQ